MCSQCCGEIVRVLSPVCVCLYCFLSFVGVWLCPPGLCSTSLILLLSPCCPPSCVSPVSNCPCSLSSGFRCIFPSLLCHAVYCESVHCCPLWPVFLCLMTITWEIYLNLFICWTGFVCLIRLFTGTYSVEQFSGVSPCFVGLYQLSGNLH